ncbi:hypothetical protein Hanom_Chr17g01549321 [Helianthus anomalus]
MLQISILTLLPLRKKQTLVMTNMGNSVMILLSILIKLLIILSFGIPFTESNYNSQFNDYFSVVYN